MTTPAPRLAAKLSKVYAEVGKLKKNGRNTKFGYDFVTESDASEAIRKELAKHGVMLYTSAERVEHDKRNTTGGGTMTISQVHLALTFVDGASGEERTVKWIGQGMDTQDKSVAKAITSGVKYCLLKTFLIPTGDDPDADTAHGDAWEQAEPAPRQRAQRQEPAKATGSRSKPRSQPAATSTPPAEDSQAQGEPEPEAKKHTEASSGTLLQQLVAKCGGQTNTWKVVNAAGYKVTRLAQLDESQLELLIERAQELLAGAK